MKAKPKDTKQRILNAAEELFARNGFRCTSLRTLTKKAGVNLAAVNYHFGSKEALVEEVIRRRIIPLNATRKQRLEEELAAAQAEGRLPAAGRLLQAFIEPTLSFSRSSQGGSNFTTLIGRALAESDETIMGIFLQFITPLFKLLFQSLCQALPDVPEDVLYWRLHFTLGSLIHTMKLVKKPVPFFGGVPSDSTTEELTSLLLDFVSTGMNQPS